MNVLSPIKTAKHLLQKLRRDVESLEKQVSSDTFINLTITGYSLVDWVAADATLPPSARTRAEIDALHKDRLIRICGDIANASKHMTLTRRMPVVTAVESKSGYGVGRYDVGPYSVGEEQIDLEVGGATIMDARQFASSLLTQWEAFFIRHGVSV